MTTIKDILKLDLSEDIKNVIDLEDQSESEIQQEIESYILTEGLAKHLSNFIKLYQSNIKETGVWLSGFYGSGKSYFGKMLGYILANQTINGTPARDRFIPRLRGIKNASILENDIRGLDAFQNRVVFLDVAKQQTNNNLSFTLFKNFLKSLGFLPNVYGYMEYLLFLDNKLEDFKAHVQSTEGSTWEEVRRNDMNVPSTMRKVLTQIRYSETEYKETLDFLNSVVKDFSPGKLQEELHKYLQKRPDETVVFVFDEASEAIGQKKFDLLELEGISEALSNSTTARKVWTMAIAQEKLDDVINNNNISRSQLIKVTDRFKTKIHLESTEVDIIIRNRLLDKKEEFAAQLETWFKQNEGLIADGTNLKSNFPTKTEKVADFVAYYPLHKYHFDLLQRFLFSSNALVANQIAARGMIITTFDVLRKQLKNKKLYDFGAAYHICEEAQTSPPASLVNKYDNAKKVLQNTHLGIDGEQLLKTIHFLSEAELVSNTVENITKAFLEDIKTYYEQKPKIEEALSLLVDAKILLLSNNNYKITSDLEAKLLEEMNSFTVELFVKKRDLVTEYLKKNSLLRSVSSITEDAITYNFQVQTDQGDEIFPSSNKNLQLVIYSLFNITENRQDFVENLKLETQHQKDTCYLAPDNSRFDAIDGLMTEVKRFGFMEEKYANDNDPNIRQIIREFSTIKEEKEGNLNMFIQEAYAKGSIIYLFDESLLNKDTFKGTVTEVQKKIIKNIYTKRLAVQLSESIGPQLLKEQSNDKLHRYLSGEDFRFFDQNGNFIGEGLKVVEEITAKIKKSFVEGKTLEAELLDPPTGYAYGTVSTTLAALLRAGKVIAHFNGQDIFSYKDPGAGDIFSTGRNFQKASFKAISKSLNTVQKNEIVQALLDLKYKEATGQKVDWNTNDFDLVDAVRNLAEHTTSAANTMRKTIADFDKLFPSAAEHRGALQHFTGKTTEANYIEKAEYFLNHRHDYENAIKGIEDTEKFIHRNLSKAQGYHRFVGQVAQELNKATISAPTFEGTRQKFEELYQNHLVDKFSDLQSLAQSVKDEYFQLMKAENAAMSAKYTVLKTRAAVLLQKLANAPAAPNAANLRQAQALLDYAVQRIHDEVRLEFHIACQNSNFTLSEMRNYNQLAAQKETELLLIESNIVTKEPEPEPVYAPGDTPAPPAPKTPRRIRLEVPKKQTTVKAYRALLASQLQALAGLDNDDPLEVDID